MRTIVLGFAISDFISAIVIASLWKQNRRRFAGLGFWLAGYLAQSMALAFIGLRGLAPDVLSITVGNAMVIGGCILLYIGMERFVGKRGPWLHNIILLLVLMIIHSHFAYFVPNLAARSITISVGLLLICFQAAWLVLRRLDPQMRPITRGADTLLAAFGLVSVVRILINLIAPPQNDFFRSGIYETALILIFQMLFMILAFNLFLMVNRRLAYALEEDAAARKQAEETLHARLRLFEFAEHHTMGELMQKALDEICALTDSAIGFYHFVEEDQKTLSLQAWSTRTLQEFCQAEGKGMHYNIDQAGVWVDCVREMKPVIHNDYAALPHRQGMPPGHAVVVRELVVPILKEGRVVSILGVGNKVSAYNQKDTALVAYIADIVWSIVERKRADEQIRQLNVRLERLAMTDELTGLPNRRSFFNRCVEEFKRAQRYRSPFSLLMLDMDGFKRINDAYGHDAGDRVLQCIAETLSRNIRQADLLARLGGEEFGVLLPATRLKDALLLAERLRQATEEQRCDIQDQQASVTVSIGVASYGSQMRSYTQVLKNADRALYRAKDLGRNRVASVKD